MARTGHTFSFTCDEDQVNRILRMIAYSDGVITDKVLKPDGVLITVCKT
jgi:hypothetical protein